MSPTLTSSGAPVFAAPGLALFGAVSVVAFVWLGGPLLRGALLRVCLALGPVIVAAGLLIWFLILPFAPRLGAAGPALVAGTVLAAGWLAAFLAAEYQKARERAQTRKDTMLALREEIFAFVEKLDKNSISTSASEVQARIARGGSGARAYQFFSSSESPTTVYDAVAANIVLLAPEVLEPVVRFYAAYSDLASFVEDVRSEAFQKLPADRRRLAHVELTRHRTATLVWGLRALCAINRALSVPSPESLPRSGENQDVEQDSAP